MAMRTGKAFRSNDARANSSLDGHTELLAWNELLQALHQPRPNAVGRVTMHNSSQGVHRLATKVDIVRIVAALAEVSNK